VTISVLLFDLPPFLNGLVSALVESRDGLALIPSEGGAALADAVTAAGADVAVLPARDGWEQEVLEALTAHPRLRAVVMAHDGRWAVACELRLSTVRTEELSPEALLEELRRPPGLDVMGGSPL
jgi:hypothetical protein